MDEIIVISNRKKKTMIINITDMLMKVTREIEVKGEKKDRFILITYV